MASPSSSARGSARIEGCQYERKPDRIEWKSKIAGGAPILEYEFSTAILGRPLPATMRSILPNQCDTLTAPVEDRFGLNNHECVVPGRPPP